MCNSLSQLLSCFMCLAVIGLTAGLSYYFLNGRNEDGGDEGFSIPEFPNLPESLRDKLPEIHIFDREDPFREVEDPSQANHWPHSGQGFSLTVINALTSEWHTYFDQAISDWDNPVDGTSPDTMTLQTETASQADPSCSTIPDVMKVCNDNYGETDWKGINTVLVDGSGIITTSVAKMNEQYFDASGSDENKRQYTMCHEVGHGFGLPHTDESFWNRDLGNCLDYTNNFSGNKTPDKMNYNFLYEVYGSVDGSAPATSASALVADNNDNNRRLRQRQQRNLLRSQQQQPPLRQRRRHLFQDVPDPVRREELLARWNEIDHLVTYGGFAALEQSEQHGGWRRLHAGEYGEGRALDLGEGYTVQVHTLRA